MSEKLSDKSLLEKWKWLLKSSEQYIEDKFDTSIDILTEPKQETEQEKTKKETKENLTILHSEVVLTKIKSQLTKWFEEFKNKINDVPDLKVLWLGFGLSKKEKKEYIQEAEKEYNELIKILESYKNDEELTEWYNKVQWKINKWIEKLQTKKLEIKESSEIIDSTTLSLENLKADMLKLKWKTKEQILEEKNKIKEKYKKNEWKDKMVSVMTKFWVPAWLAWILAWLFTWMWFWKKETWFFSKALDFVKDPWEWAKSLFGFWKDKKEEAENETQETEKETKEEKIITKWKFENNWKYSSYVNWNLEIKLKKTEIKHIKINWKKYKFNLPNLWEMSFIQNNKDILKIWDKKIDLLNIVESTKEDKDEYLIASDFDNSKDLKLIKS